MGVSLELLMRVRVGCCVLRLRVIEAIGPGFGLSIILIE